MSNEEKAIQAKLQAFNDAFNAHDAKQLGALFVEDADFVNIFGQWFQGRAAIAEGHAQGFQGALGGNQLAMTSAEVKLLKPDLALCHVRWHREQAASQGLPTQGGVMTVVLSKRDAEWWYVAVHNTQTAPAPP